VFFESNFLNFLAHKMYYSHLKTVTWKNCGEDQIAGKVLYPGARMCWVPTPILAALPPGKRPITQCTGGCGSESVLMGTGDLSPTGVWTSDCAASSRSLFLQRCSGRL